MTITTLPKVGSDIIIRKLSILVKINQAVSRSLNLQNSLNATLQVLHESYPIKSGAVFLMDEETGLLNMEASIGYRRETAKTVYKPGEGLTGRIAATAKPIIVPQVSKELLFLNRMSSWDPAEDRGQTFIGVPIIMDYKTLGVLIVNLPYTPKRDYDSAMKFLTLVASALLQPIQLNHLVDLERKKMLDEKVLFNEKLKEEFSFHTIIGNSHEMREVYEKVAQVAGANTTVLVRGESGTG